MSKTEFNKNLVNFSSNWEKYVNDCKRIENGTLKYYPKKDHKVHLLLKNDIKENLESYVNPNNYKVETSDGKGQLAGIPWLSVMDKNITTSTQRGFYVSYLFSRNARKLYLSIALGATQFEDLYGANNKTTLKIQNATKQFLINFTNYQPYEQKVDINLKNEEDQNFSRIFTPAINRIVDYYEAGSFFTISYDLQDENFLTLDLVNDLYKYLDSYQRIISDPRSSLLIDVLDEIVHEESDSKDKNFEYTIPTFNPVSLKQDEENNLKSTKSSKGKGKNNSLRTPTKKVGLAGEEYVYDYLFHNLMKEGKENLANKIVKQYEDLNEYPGYDIKSFDSRGNEIYIEVKSTKGKKNESFNISKNELDSAKKHRTKYYIYLVVNALTDPKIYQIIPDPIKYLDDNKISIQPLTYTVTFDLGK